MIDLIMDWNFFISGDILAVITKDVEIAVDAAWQALIRNRGSE